MAELLSLGLRVLTEVIISGLLAERQRSNQDAHFKLISRGKKTARIGRRREARSWEDRAREVRGK
jgi:hypothetical protein